VDTGVGLVTRENMEQPEIKELLRTLERSRDPLATTVADLDVHPPSDSEILTSLSDAVMVLDTSHWGEATDSARGCPISTGLFAGFFGRFADAPISVLEVPTEPAVSGACRFLLGSVDVLHYVWEAMERGIPYERAAASA
jgi:hypothetical protein